MEVQSVCAVALTLSQGTAVYSLACFAYTFMDDLEGHASRSPAGRCRSDKAVNRLTD